MKKDIVKISTARLHLHQRGAALIEVLVSMFILALGVMALLAMQVRTSSGIREAENMSIVAAATQNLANGLMINPTLEPGTGINASNTNAAYDLYNRTNGDVCAGQTNATPAASSVMTRSQMADGHIAEFCSNMLLLPGMNPENIHMKICNNDRIVPGELPFDFSCGTNGTDTVIKVAWKMQKSANDPNAVIYSYQHILSK